MQDDDFDSTIIVIHACGYADEYHICQTFLSRIARAVALLRKIGPRKVMVSGGVKYARSSSHLLVYYSILALQKMLQSDLELWIRCRLVHAQDGYNSSTDVQNFLRLAKEQKALKIIAISSYWHHWTLGPLYFYWIEKMQMDITVEFIHPDDDSAGIKTKIFYAIYGLLTSFCILLGLFPIFDRLLNKLHSKRRISGYPVSGCD